MHVSPLFRFFIKDVGNYDEISISLIECMCT